MKLVVAAVGKPRDAALAAAIRHYEERAAHYWPLESIEVKEESARHLAPSAVMEREGERLLARVPPGAALVLCDAQGGQGLSSPAFAERVQGWREAARDVVFVIGGAFGVSDAVRQAATLRLALAPWTLPHELARLVLVEQLYRAGTILRGEPYHK